LQNLSQGGHFLNLELIDLHGRPAFGARVRVLAGGQIQAGELVAGGSYLAVSEPRVCFGLGQTTVVGRIEVDWPWGTSEVWSKRELPARGLIRLVQGTGRPIP
jgi:enediyne biosynthesis protein E4